MAGLETQPRDGVVLPVEETYVYKFLLKVLPQVLLVEKTQQWHANLEHQQRLNFKPHLHKTHYCTIAFIRVYQTSLSFLV